MTSGFSVSAAVKVQGAINDARMAFVRGQRKAVLSHYDVALQGFTQFCVQRGVISHAQVTQLHASLAIQEADLSIPSLEVFVDRLFPVIQASMADGKKVVVITGPSAVGKNIFAKTLTEKVNKNSGEACLIDIDDYNFVKRERIVGDKSFTSQIAEADLLDLEMFIRAIKEAISEGKTVVLPIYLPLLPREFLQSWPTLTIYLRGSQTDRANLHHKLLRTLLFKSSDVAIALEKMGNSFLLDFVGRTGFRWEEIVREILPDVSVLYESGRGISLVNGQELFSVDDVIDVFAANPFFGALTEGRSFAVLSAYAAQRKMLGMIELWKRLAGVSQ